MDRPVDLDFVKKLPKIELHAHLSGSISPSCLHDVWLAKKLADPSFELEDPNVILDTDVDINTFFPLFGKCIYRLIDTKDAIHKSTTGVLQDFEADGVVYLELRTTPRTNSQITKRTYIVTVLDAIDEYTQDFEHELKTQLILSIDRGNSVQEALETVGLALELRARGVVGIDLCGKPGNDITHLLPVLAEAKASGLKLTVHFAEIESPKLHQEAVPFRDELGQLLKLKPHRLGHVIHVQSEHKQTILENNIGLELCLSCNVVGKLTKGSYADHHFGWWWKQKYNMIALCTDDVGIFRSPLSQEYMHAAAAFQLSRADVMDLAEHAISMVFSEAEKSGLLKKFKLFRMGVNDGKINVKESSI